MVSRAAAFTAASVPPAEAMPRFLLRLHRTGAVQRLLDGALLLVLPGVMGGLRATISIALAATVANE